MKLNILIVGAGAVGQTYGLHLHRAGHKVTFLVRDRVAREIRKFPTLSLHRLRLLRAPQPVRFQDFAVLGDSEALTQHVFDQVWLCVSSTALAKGDWLPALVRSQPKATIVTLQPGLRDGDVVGKLCGEARLVIGMISLVAYQAPLEAEVPHPGVAYLLPPGAPSPFSGAEPARVDAVVRALVDGGCPAKRVADAKAPASFASALMMPHLLALQGAGWSLGAVRHGSWLDRAAAASRDATAAVSAHLHVPPPLGRLAARPVLIATAVGLGTKLAPFPLEAYLRYHFTKTLDQTHAMVNTYVEVRHQHGLEMRDLEALRDAVRRGLG